MSFRPAVRPVKGWDIRDIQSRSRKSESIDNDLVAKSQYIVTFLKAITQGASAAASGPTLHH